MNVEQQTPWMWKGDSLLPGQRGLERTVVHDLNFGSLGSRRENREAGYSQADAPWSVFISGRAGVIASGVVIGPDFRWLSDLHVSLTVVACCAQSVACDQARSAVCLRR